MQCHVLCVVNMRDLAAQVTSSLLRFPGVTVDALGEDEITLDSVLHGKFTVGKSVCMHGGHLSQTTQCI